MATYEEALTIKREMDKWLPMGDTFLQAPLKEKIDIYRVIEYGYDTLSKMRKGFGYGSIEDGEVSRWLKEFAPGIYNMKQAIMADPQLTAQIRDAFVAKQWAAIKNLPLVGPAVQATVTLVKKKAELDAKIYKQVTGERVNTLLYAAGALLVFGLLGRFMR